jgi:hypothetical protein
MTAYEHPISFRLDPEVLDLRTLGTYLGLG